MSDADKARETDVLTAGHAFRETLVPRADSWAPGHAPLWYGWAIMDAFLAGADFGRAGLTWTATPPDREGSWWFRTGPVAEPQIIQVTGKPPLLSIWWGDQLESPKRVCREWPCCQWSSAPIESPSEPEEPK